MAADPDRPGPNDLVTPFVFVPHGAPDPVAWKQAPPGWVSFPATFVPHKRPPRKWTVLKGKRWPLDKRGQPWPSSRFGQPMCPLDEFPPGMPAPGTQGRLIEEEAAAVRRRVEVVTSGKVVVTEVMAEAAGMRAERQAMAMPNPNQPAAYLDDGFGPAREYLAAMRELDARSRELTESARNWTPARPDSEHASPAGGPVLSGSDGPRMPPPDDALLALIADKRRFYGPDIPFWPGSPSNQALVRDTEKAIRALRDDPGFTPTAPLPPPSPFPAAPSLPGMETFPAEEGASRPNVLSTPRAPALPTATPGDVSDLQQAIVMEARRNEGLDPELRSYSERSRQILREGDISLKRALLAETDWRAHHLIPHQAVRNNVELLQAAARAGYRIDNPGNLVALPIDEPAQGKLRAVGAHRPIHDNRHRTWNADRLLEVREISARLAREGRLSGSADYNYRAKFLLEELETRARTLLPSQQRLTAIEFDRNYASGLG